MHETQARKYIKNLTGDLYLLRDGRLYLIACRIPAWGVLRLVRLTVLPPQPAARATYGVSR